MNDSTTSLLGESSGVSFDNQLSNTDADIFNLKDCHIQRNLVITFAITRFRYIEVLSYEKKTVRYIVKFFV